MIEFQKLTKRFGGFTAVDSLEFQVPKGSIFGFLGPNGAGKTTTIRMLMGLLTPSFGTAKVLGLDIVGQSLEVKSKVGYLPDDVFLYDYLTGRQFLEFVGDIRGLDGAALQKEIKSLLYFFGLEDNAGDYTANYSYGMKKKLALAGIVLHKPEVIILDEPFNGLDPMATRDFQKMLQTMAQQGTTIIFSSHVLVMVEKLVSHVGIIDQGRMLRISPLKELLDTEKNSLEEIFFSLIPPKKNNSTTPPAL